MLEIVCFDPFVLNLRELSSDNIELHPNEDISKESLPVFALANLRIAILPLSSPEGSHRKERRPRNGLRRLSEASI